MAPETGYNWANANIGGGGSFPRLTGSRKSASGTPYDVTLAAADVAALYYSYAGGALWGHKDTADGLNDQNCYAVAIDPVDNLRWFLACEGGGGGALGGLQRTVDGGATWTTVNESPDPVITGFFNEVHCSPCTETGSVTYAVKQSAWNALQSYLYKCPAQDSPFSLQYTFAAGVRIIKVLTDVASAETVYALSGNQPVLSIGNVVGGVEQNPAQKSLWRSTDGGTTFTRIGPGAFYDVIDFAVHPEQNSYNLIAGVNPIIFCSTALNGTWRSGDSGDTWTPISVRSGCVIVGRQQPTLMAVLVPADPTSAWVSPTLEGTGTWSPEETLVSGDVVADDLLSPGAIGVASYVIVKADVRLDNPYTQGLYPDDSIPASTPRLLWKVGAEEGEYALPTDWTSMPQTPEAEWFTVATAPQYATPGSLAWNAENLATVTAIGFDTLLVSADGSFGPANAQVAMSNARMEIWGNTAWVAIIDPDGTGSAAGTYLSRDTGDTFTHYPRDSWDTDWKGGVDKWGMYSKGGYGYATTLAIENLHSDPSHTQRIYWGTQQFCFMSSDRGITFRQVYCNKVGDAFSSRGIDNVEVTALSGSGETIYGAVYDLGIMRSADFGTSWKSINDYRYSWKSGGGTPSNPYVPQLGGACLTVLTLPGRPSRVFTALASDPDEAFTLLHSSDGGDTWTPATAPTGFILGLVADPVANGTLTAQGDPIYDLYVTINGNVYRSTDDGVTWALKFTHGGMRCIAGSGQVWFVGGEGGLYRTMAGWGTTPSRVANSQFPATALADYHMQWKGCQSVVYDRVNHVVYATYYNASNTGAGSTGLFKSADAYSGGTTWTLELADGWSRKVFLDSNGTLWHSSSSAAKAGGNRSVSGGSTGLKRKTEGGSWALAADWTLGGFGSPVNFPKFVWPIHVEVAYSNPRVMIGAPGVGFVRGTYSGGGAT